MARIPLLRGFLLVLLTPVFALPQTTPQQPAPVAREKAQPPERIPPPSPDMSPSQLELKGDELNAHKYFLDAIDYYQAAIEKQDSPMLRVKVGVALLRMTKAHEARKEFERAVKMNKNMAVAHNNLGAADYALGDYGRAVKEYRKAIRLEDDVASFHSNLGAAYFAQKDYKKAADEYGRAVDLDPTIFDRQWPGGYFIHMVNSHDKGRFHYLIAQMYARQGDMDRCRLFLSKANEEGYPYINDALKDDEFAGLRKDPNFVTFVKTLKATATSDDN